MHFSAQTRLLGEIGDAENDGDCLEDAQTRLRHHVVKVLKT